MNPSTKMLIQYMQYQTPFADSLIMSIHSSGGENHILSALADELTGERRDPRYAAFLGWLGGQVHPVSLALTAIQIAGAGWHADDLALVLLAAMPDFTSAHGNKADDFSGYVGHAFAGMLALTGLSEHKAKAVIDAFLTRLVTLDWNTANIPANDWHKWFATLPFEQRRDLLLAAAATGQAYWLTRWAYSETDLRALLEQANREPVPV